jgi:hypothetical protein
MQMKPVVICALAGKPAPLQGLLDLLGNRFSFVVHLDAKAGPVSEALRLPAGLVLTERRYPVFWGGFNMIFAIREMIDAAYKHFPGFTRVVVITGDTLPTAHPDVLENSLRDPHIEFMYSREIAFDPSLRGLSMEEAARNGALHEWRFQNYVVSDDELHSPRSQGEAQRKFRLTKDQADYVRGASQVTMKDVLSKMPPRPRLYDRIFSGSSWWSLSRGALNLIIDDMHAAANVEYFRFVNVPDEHFFQTLIGNKSRALAELGHRTQGKFVYVDYKHPDRLKFTGRDALSVASLRSAAAAGWPFARKYDPEQTPEIADAIASGRYFAEIVSESNSSISAAAAPLA